MTIDYLAQRNNKAKSAMQKAFQKQPYMNAFAEDIIFPQFGGEYIAWRNRFGGLTKFEVKKISNRGKEIKGEIINITLVPQNCHSNARFLAEHYSGLRLYSGIALSEYTWINRILRGLPNVWCHHSWCVWDGKIIETTNSFIKYFGYEDSLLKPGTHDFSVPSEKDRKMIIDILSDEFFYENDMNINK